MSSGSTLAPPLGLHGAGRPPRRCDHLLARLRAGGVDHDLTNGIASRMRDGEPLDARATAAPRPLHIDGAGPRYGPARPEALRAALETVAQWL
jgi:hypothetical protein